MSNELNDNQQQQIYACFAQLLDYPTPGYIESINTCIDLLKADYATAATLVADFQNRIKAIPMSRLEEVYTETFDINPACHIFAGHILFGESFKRNAFMASLAEEYQERNFSTGKELVDHIPLLLKFLSISSPDDAFTEDLAADCLVPVFQKMNTNFPDDAANPYMPLLRSVSIVLEKFYPKKSEPSPNPAAEHDHSYDENSFPLVYFKEK